MNHLLLVLALSSFAVLCGSLGAVSALSEPDTDIPYVKEVLIQLAVSDLDRSMTFYVETLGLKLSDHIPDLEWAKYDTAVPGLRIGIGRQDKVAGSGTISINLGVSDLDDARQKLESRGVEFPKPSMNIPGVVKLADFVDPDGNRLRLAGPPDKAE